MECDIRPQARVRVDIFTLHGRLTGFSLSSLARGTENGVEHLHGVLDGNLLIGIDIGVGEGARKALGVLATDDDSDDKNNVLLYRSRPEMAMPAG